MLITYLMSIYWCITVWVYTRHVVKEQVTYLVLPLRLYELLYNWWKSRENATFHILILACTILRGSSISTYSVYHMDEINFRELLCLNNCTMFDIVWCMISFMYILSRSIARKCELYTSIFPLYFSECCTIY